MTLNEILIPAEEIRHLAQDIIRSYQDGGGLIEIEELIEKFIEESGCNLTIVPMD